MLDSDPKDTPPVDENVQGGMDGDPVVKTKSTDILLTKYAASGPQEEPDPTTGPIMDSLAPQLKNSPIRG